MMPSMKRLTAPPLNFNDVARLQWEHYVEAKISKLHDEPVKPSRKRMRPGEVRYQRHDEALLL
jgi:hypothetical protein